MKHFITTVALITLLAGTGFAQRPETRQVQQGYVQIMLENKHHQHFKAMVQRKDAAKLKHVKRGDNLRLLANPTGSGGFGG